MNWLLGISVFFLVLLLAACGGGGGSTSSAAALVDPPAQPVAFLFAAAVGDSTMAGAGGKEPPTAVTERLLREWTGKPGLTIRNDAYSGTSAAKMLLGTDGSNMPWAQRVDWLGAPIVIVNHAHNDTRGTAQEYRANLEAIARIAHERGVTLVFETSNPAMTGSGWEVITAEFAQVMREVAIQSGSRLCDVHRAMEQGGMVTPDNYLDHVHLKTSGYDFVGKTLAECLLPLVP